jgi:hypothetical protein
MAFHDTAARKEGAICAGVDIRQGDRGFFRGLMTEWAHRKP